jgi:hypothetical protein
VRPPGNTFAVVITLVCAAALGCACGTVSPGLTTQGALAPQAGATIASDDAVRIIFHREVDQATLAGNVYVTQNQGGTPHVRRLREEGFILVIEPILAWREGELTITLIGGESGIRYADGRGFASITLTYFVGNR